jgi:hypothetical protein
LDKNERQYRWNQAHQRTVDALTSTGQWPKDVPLPYNGALEVAL